jgi:hypothetical protein
MPLSCSLSEKGIELLDHGLLSIKLLKSQMWRGETVALNHYAILQRSKFFKDYLRFLSYDGSAAKWVAAVKRRPKILYNLLSPSRLQTADQLIEFFKPGCYFRSKLCFINVVGFLSQ